jgi:hypothetical protein
LGCWTLKKKAPRFLKISGTFYQSPLRNIPEDLNLQQHRCGNYISKFHGSVHLKNFLIYIQQDTTLHVLFYLETALHVLGCTSTHHQERKQLYPQHLVFVTPLLLPAAIAAGKSSGVYV